MTKTNKNLENLKKMSLNEMLAEVEKDPSLMNEIYEEMLKIPEFRKQCAQQYASPIVQASNTYLSYKHKEECLNYEDIAQELEAQTQALRTHDLTRIEDILMAQAQTLDLLFHKQARKASAQQYLNQFKVHLDMALKAQRQCRSTLEALAEIKNPKPYIQNNQAQYQQINNGSQTALAREENLKSPNKLLEDKTYDREWMDRRTQEATITNDKELETMETKHRTEN